jgi:hypothetical protein
VGVLIPTGVSIGRRLVKTPDTFRTEQEYLENTPRSEWDRQSDAAALRLYWLLLLLVAILGSLCTSIYYHQYLFESGNGLRFSDITDILMAAGFGLALLLPAVQLGVGVIALVVITLGPTAYFHVKRRALIRILTLTGWMLAGTLAGTGVMIALFAFFK